MHKHQRLGWTYKQQGGKKHTKTRSQIKLVFSSYFFKLYLSLNTIIKVGRTFMVVHFRVLFVVVHGWVCFFCCWWWLVWVFFLLGGGEEIEYDNADHTLGAKCFFITPFTWNLKLYTSTHSCRNTDQRQLPSSSVSPM